ncbi:MAG: GNAT family N-acetyltransferase [Verrucomicrobiaceae bacterium]|nr:MAG: GNAT family N-acetyltransferase [Verrucomicrobiaceae bacterium]
MPATIRPFTGADTVDMSSLMADLGYPSTPEQVAERMRSMSADYYHTLVAEVEGKVVGFIGIIVLPVYEYSIPVGWILALSVAEAYRRKGIGKALIAAAEGDLRARGIEDVRLHSGLQREDAHEFYTRLGYDKTGYRFKKRLLG